MPPKKVKTPMPEQPPDVRNKNFDEVALGYDEESALLEADRCLQCPTPFCVKGCPADINIPGFIKKIREKNYAGAVEVIREKNALPSVCGRVCPQEIQCEGSCILAKMGEPVSIGRLERFVGDYALANNIKSVDIKESTQKTVAIVGSGPSGLAAAADLAKLGHKVTIYEALHKPGGVLVYGIPEFRLPKEEIVAKEIDYVINDLGVELKLNSAVGYMTDINKLREEYDAVYIGVGAGAPKFMNIEGENLLGVYSANEFLTRSNLMKAYKFPEYDTPIIVGKNVAVVGGGNVAMDAARTAMRLGAENVYLVYRRGEEEIPARREELHHAKEEGLILKLLNNPVRIIGDEKGWVKGIECIKMELGEPDASGRRRPSPIKGSEFILDVETVIMAIGTNANPLATHTAKGLKLNKWNYIETDENGRTSLPDVWAGGDIVTGAATVILAIGAGKKAAADMHKYLIGEKE